MTARRLAGELVNCFKNKGKVFICGNGGSATMSSHFAGELVCKYKEDRIALPAISLTADTAIITAISNDYHFNEVFVRQLQALANEGDVLVVLSTSGKSKNCLKAIEWANKAKLRVLDWPREGGSVGEIQEKQLKLIHNVCELIEKEFI